MWQVIIYVAKFKTKKKNKKLHNAFAEVHVLVGFKCPILHLDCLELIIRTSTY